MDESKSTNGKRKNFAEELGETGKWRSTVTYKRHVGVETQLGRRDCSSSRGHAERGRESVFTKSITFQLNNKAIVDIRLRSRCAITPPAKSRK